MADGVALASVEHGLAMIARDNDRIRAISHHDPGNARARAEAIDARADKGALYGLTFVAKDQIDVAGLPTCCGSRLFGAVPASADAACIRSLQAVGAVVVGKSNMHELAVGSAKNPWFGQVINPLSPAHGTGGTSSGSAAAVAAGFCDFALGTDSGGSNRSVAAAVGIYGFKPTNGELSNEGVLPIAPTLDTLGILARDAKRLSEVFAALSCRPPDEPTTLEGKVIACPNGLYGAVDGLVQDAMHRAIATIRAGGGRVVEVEVTGADTLVDAGRTILRYEFARKYGQDIVGRPDLVSPQVQTFAQSATAVSFAEYEQAKGLILEQRAVWHKQLNQIDAMLVPTAPGLAPRLTDEHTKVQGHWVAYGLAGAAFRMWANTMGLPAVAIPIHRQGSLPASVQLAARPQADGFLISLAVAMGRL